MALKDAVLAASRRPAPDADLWSPGRLWNAVTELWAGLDPARAFWSGIDWVLALPPLPKIAAAVLLLWVAVLLVLTAVRFGVLLVSHAIEGGLLFVDYAAAQLMRLLLRGWDMTKAVALLAVWALLAPPRLLLDGTLGAAAGLVGALRRRGGKGKAATEPEPTDDYARALRVLRLAEGFTQAEFRARVKELRRHLNSDQHEGVSDFFVQQVNQAAELVRSRMGYRR